MSSFPYQNIHQQLAEDLYGQRAGILKAGQADALSLIALERRLMVHLSVLALLAEADLETKGKDAVRFVNFSMALQSNDQQMVEAACRLALTQLANDDLAVDPILDALTFFPPDTRLLTSLYQTCPESRCQLFILWHRLLRALPVGLLNQAELQTLDSKLQCQVLTYAADHPAYGIDIFRAYYANLLSYAPQARVPDCILEPVLWGGLVRGDPEVPLAIQRALGLVGDEKVRMRLLRLLALNGDAAHLPVILEFHRYEPVEGAYLLALTGLAEGVPYLVEGLGKPEMSQANCRAWDWMTGAPLPERPCLMLVGEDGTTMSRPADPGHLLRQVPDQHVAQSWWESHRQQWGGQRWIKGASQDSQGLFSLAQERIGEPAQDVMALLSLKLGRPLGISPWGWQSLRQQKLQALSRELDKQPSSARSG